MDFHRPDCHWTLWEDCSQDSRYIVNLIAVRFSKCGIVFRVNKCWVSNVYCICVFFFSENFRALSTGMIPNYHYHVPTPYLPCSTETYSYPV